MLAGSKVDVSNVGRPVAVINKKVSPFLRCCIITVIDPIPGSDKIRRQDGAEGWASIKFGAQPANVQRMKQMAKVFLSTTIAGPFS